MEGLAGYASSSDSDDSTHPTGASAPPSVPVSASSVAVSPASGTASSSSASGTASTASTAVSAASAARSNHSGFSAGLPAPKRRGVLAGLPPPKSRSATGPTRKKVSLSALLPGHDLAVKPEDKVDAALEEELSRAKKRRVDGSGSSLASFLPTPKYSSSPSAPPTPSVSSTPSASSGKSSTAANPSKKPESVAIETVEEDSDDEAVETSGPKPSLWGVPARREAAPAPSMSFAPTLSVEAAPGAVSQPIRAPVSASAPVDPASAYRVPTAPPADPAAAYRVAPADPAAAYRVAPDDPAAAYRVAPADPAAAYRVAPADPAAAYRVAPADPAAAYRVASYDPAAAYRVAPANPTPAYRAPPIVPSQPPPQPPPPPAHDTMALAAYYDSAVYKDWYVAYMAFVQDQMTAQEEEAPTTARDSVMQVRGAERSLRRTVESGAFIPEGFVPSGVEVVSVDGAALRGEWDPSTISVGSSKKPTTGLKMPSRGGKRKHQLAALAYEASAREEQGDLPGHGAHSKAQTMAKYGW